MTTPRHFLSLQDLDSTELRALIQRAAELKSMRKRGENHEPLKNRVLGMVFEKSSTRTRVSFETAMIQFGGNAIFLSPRDTQLGRGELIEDTARVLSRMVDIIMIRTYEHEKLECFAAHSRVPVINGLSDKFHPCQLLADLFTYAEHRGDISGKNVAWIGDGNNMCHSYINASTLLEFNLQIACPHDYEPDPNILATSNKVTVMRSPLEAARGADLVVTDVWASMGQEDERLHRLKVFKEYQVNQEVMTAANKDAIFMHCLPAHRGEEVTTAVIDGPQSVVWDEAENRLHSQKALLELLIA